MGALGGVEFKRKKTPSLPIFYGGAWGPGFIAKNPQNQTHGAQKKYSRTTGFQRKKNKNCF